MIIYSHTCDMPEIIMFYMYVITQSIITVGTNSYIGIS